MYKKEQTVNKYYFILNDNMIEMVVVLDDFVIYDRNMTNYLLVQQFNKLITPYGVKFIDTIMEDINANADRMRALKSKGITRDNYIIYSFRFNDKELAFEYDSLKVGDQCRNSMVDKFNKVIEKEALAIVDEIANDINEFKIAIKLEKREKILNDIYEKLLDLPLDTDITIFTTPSGVPYKITEQLEESSVCSFYKSDKDKTSPKPIWNIKEYNESHDDCCTCNCNCDCETCGEEDETIYYIEIC